MRIIDLLNKIANCEDVPEKIKYENKILYYDNEDNEDNCYNATFNYYDKSGNNELFNGCIAQFLNDEIEIIEEEKKIPEKLDILKDEEGRIDGVFMARTELTTRVKINEIIDYLKSKESDK